MARLQSQYILDGNPLWYEILPNGYNIYFRESDPAPYKSQVEPFIPFRKPEDDTSGLSEYEYSCFKQMAEMIIPLPEVFPDPTDAAITELQLKMDSAQEDITSIQEGMCEVYELVLMNSGMEDLEMQ